MDKSDLFIEPTLLTGVDMDSKLMQDEIFGPLLPIVAVKDADEAISIVRAREKPLAMYIFTKDATFKEKVMKFTTSGGVCVNDTIMHIANPHLPFGGVGPSGIGSYHGFYGFKAFSHERSVMTRATWVDPAIRYPPYTERKLKYVVEFWFRTWLCSSPVSLLHLCFRMANMIVNGIQVPKAAVAAVAVIGTAGAYYYLKSRL